MLLIKQIHSQNSTKYPKSKNHNMILRQIKFSINNNVIKSMHKVIK